MTEKPPLRDYQQEGIDWLLGAERALLADEPGLGKSRQLIEASRGRTLVVAPGMVITGGTWDEEITRWADDPARFTVAPFTRLNARVRTGNGSATRPTAELRPEYEGPWDTLIVDEAHYIKGRKTSWTKAVLQLAKESDRVYLATGTPIANWAPELFTLLQALDPQAAKPGGDLGSYWRWVGTWFHVMPSKFNPRASEIGDLRACVADCLNRPAHDPCEHYAQFMDANLGDRFKQRKREECLDLPPLTEQTIQTPLTAPARKIYRRLKAEYIAQAEEGGEEKVAWSAGSRNDMLDLCTTSPWFLGDMESEPSGGKLDRLREDLANRSRPTLVLAHHRAVVEACCAVARSTGARAEYVHGQVDKKAAARAVARFKSGELDVLVGSLETLAEGLTLTAADLVIFVEMSYKPYRNEQAKRRIHRLGQTRPVTALYYQTPRTVDASRSRLLATKTDRQIRFMSVRDFASLL